MSAYTSQQTGNWSRTSDNADSPWYDGSTQTGYAAAPGIGDTVTLSHDVTVDADVTFGTSPDDQTTKVLSMGANKTLTIAAGYTLTVRGNMDFTWLELEAGSSFLVDPSNSASQTQYSFILANWPGLVISGTSENRCTFGAIDEYIFNTAYLGSIWATTSLEYCLFQNIDNGGSAVTIGTPSGGVTVDHCIFDNVRCPTLAQHDQPYTFTNNEVRNGLETGGGIARFYNVSATASGSRTITNNVFRGAVWIDTYDGVFTDNYLHKIKNAKAENPWATFSNNFMIIDNDPLSIAQTVEDCYFATTGSSHIITDSTTLYRSFSVDGCIFHVDANATDSDSIISGSGDSDNTMSIVNNIFLPNSVGTGSGTNFQCTDDTDTGRWIYNHNTVCVSDDGESGVCVGYSDKMSAGQMTSFRSNLFWTPDGEDGGFKAWRPLASDEQDMIDTDYCDYNWGWNLGTGTEGNGYESLNSTNDMFTVATSTLDTNGGSGDPQFVDADRTLPLYDTHASGLANSSGTAWADATSYEVGNVVSAATAGFYGGATINYRCINDHTSDDGDATDGKPGDTTTTSWRTNWEYQSEYRLREDTTRIASMVTWVKAGFKVQNSSLNNAGHDGETIGAVAFDSVPAKWSLVGNNYVRS
jgi:hypothetical protein